MTTGFASETPPHVWIATSSADVGSAFVCTDGSTLYADEFSYQFAAVLQSYGVEAPLG